MNVGELRAALSGMANEAEVVIDLFDLEPDPSLPDEAFASAPTRQAYPDEDGALVIEAYYVDDEADPVSVLFEERKRGDA